MRITKNLKPWHQQGFPGGPIGKESSCQCRRHGSDPWSAKIPHAEEQLSPCATTNAATEREAQALQQEKVRAATKM